MGDPSFLVPLAVAGIAYLLAIREFFSTPKFPRHVIVIGLVLAALWHLQFLRMPPGPSGVCNTRASGGSAACSCTRRTRRFPNRNPIEKRISGIVFGRICLADGGIAFVRTGRVSVVPAMDVAVSSVTLHAADHHLDGEHLPHLCRLAFTYAWRSVVGSWLGYAA